MSGIFGGAVFPNCIPVYAIDQIPLYPAQIASSDDVAIISSLNSQLSFTRGFRKQGVSNCWEQMNVTPARVLYDDDLNEFVMTAGMQAMYCSSDGIAWNNISPEDIFFSQSNLSLNNTEDKYIETYARILDGNGNLVFRIAIFDKRDRTLISKDGTLTFGYETLPSNLAGSFGNGIILITFRVNRGSGFSSDYSYVSNDDGVTWQLRQYPFQTFGECLDFEDGEFISIGNSAFGAGNRVYRKSVDGVNWTVHNYQENESPLFTNGVVSRRIKGKRYYVFHNVDSQSVAGSNVYVYEGAEVVSVLDEPLSYNLYDFSKMGDVWQCVVGDRKDVCQSDDLLSIRDCVNLSCGEGNCNTCQTLPAPIADMMHLLRDVRNLHV